MQRFFISFLLMVLSSTAHAAYTLNMGEGVTPIAHWVYDLHMTIFWICCAISVVVFGVMFWSILRHRKSVGHQAHHFHESTVVEIIWTIVPFVILIAMAIPATRVLIKMHDMSDSNLSIKVTGYQWKWEYDYIEHGVKFISSLSTNQDEISNLVRKNPHYLLEADHHMVVPVGQKIRFLTTANDVIHSFWVPDLGMKKDAVPGFINEMWAIIEKPGIYRGQCAELCGALHAFMPIVIEAVSIEEFNAWLEKQKTPKAPEEGNPT